MNEDKLTPEEKMELHEDQAYKWGEPAEVTEEDEQETI